MKLTKEQKIEFINNIESYRRAKLDFSAKCDLCGHKFKAIHKSHNMKADCPNCENEVYTLT